MKKKEKKIYERPLIRPLNASISNKFGRRTEWLPLTHIDGIPVVDLINEFGSPLFVYSEKKIRDNFMMAKRAFETRYPKIQFAWSYKTCYLNAVCNVYHQMGSWAEVVSGFEYEKALQNGVPGDKIIFNGPDKSKHDLLLAMKNNSLIHIDHFDELYLLTELASTSKSKPRVAIRINMDTGVYPQWDRFGFNYENGQAWEAVNKILMNDALDLVGIHTHIGTFMMTPSAYAVATAKMTELAIQIKKKFNHIITYIDMGGGFASKNTLKGSYYAGADAVPDIGEYAEAITSALLNAGFDRNNLPFLYLETGRALVDDTGFLLGTVLANKRLADGRRATILDFGVNTLFTSFWYDHKISPAQEMGHYAEETILYGPLCMNIDVVRDAISLPPLKPGQHVVAQYVGAYNITQSMQFITFRPAVVMIDREGRSHLIRKRESLDYVQKNEILPSHLKKLNW